MTGRTHDSDAETYGDEEAKRRFEATVRGARVAVPTPMKEIPPKRKKSISSREKDSKK
jgi:hypothetical protein